jgi:hypothetical protein
MMEFNELCGDWNGDAEIVQNPLFSANFWGFLRFSEEK